MEVVEQQVEIEIIFADTQMELTAHEGETRAEFQEEFLDVIDQAGFEVAFDGAVMQRQEG